MKNKKVQWTLLLIAVFIAITLIKAQVEETFYHEKFDGAWAGSFNIPSSRGPVKFPAVININQKQLKGTPGFALLPKSFETSPEELVLYNFKQFTKAGNNITIKIDVESEPDEQGETTTFTHTLKLAFRKAKNILKGSLSSTDPAIKGKRPMELYPQDPEKPLQKIWEMTVQFDGVKTPVFLQLVQKDAVDAEATAAMSDVTGFGFVGEDSGKITNGSFDGTKFTGNLNLSSELVLLEGQVRKGPKLFTKLNAMTYTRSKVMRPVGTRGNVVKIRNATPGELFIDHINLVRIKGNNIYPAAMVHVSDPRIRVDFIEHVNRSTLLACLFVPGNIPADQVISLRLVNVNGEFFDRTNAFTTKISEQPTTVSFAQDIQSVFNQSCALSGCHTGSSPSEGLNLSQGQAYGNIVNVASRQRPSEVRIRPNDVQGSYLIRKIKGDNISGSRMPLNRSPLSAEVIARFENWVNEGAQNN